MMFCVLVKLLIKQIKCKIAYFKNKPPAHVTLAPTTYYRLYILLVLHINCKYTTDDDKNLAILEHYAYYVVLETAPMDPLTHLLSHTSIEFVSYL